jgi:hypothetical protein
MTINNRGLTRPSSQNSQCRSGAFMSRAQQSEWNMRIGKRFTTIIPDLSATLARFPGPAVASLIMCVVANLAVAEENFADDQFYSDALWGGAAAFIASGSAHLFAESRGWTASRNNTFSLLTGLAAAVIFLLHRELGVDRWFSTVGLVLLLMTAAYLRPGASQAAFWLFNLRLGLAAILAGLVTAAACGGVSAILASLEFLFEIKMHGDLYQHVWSTGVTLLGPIYGLALTPAVLDEEVDLDNYRDSLLERGVSVLLTYILIPLVLIYTAILYAYAARIALAWTLPKGQIATLVTLFALAGTAAYLISYPWRSRGTALLRMFRSAWFPLTIIPVVLLVIGTWRRIHDYGITPERYALVAIAAWLIGLIVVFVHRRRSIDIRYIVASFGAVALVTSIGPWGARTLSMTDQFGRLETLLSRHGFLINGRIPDTTPPPAAMADDERETAGSIVHFLVDREEHERFRPWFAGRMADPWKRSDFKPSFVAETLISIVGYRHRETPGNNQQVSFDASVPLTFSPAAGNVIAGPIKLRRGTRQQLEQSPRVLGIENRGSALAILHGDRTWLIKTSDLLAQAVDVDALPSSRPPLSITLGEPPERMTLIVDQLYGEFDRGQAKVHSGQFWLVLPQ